MRWRHITVTTGFALAFLVIVLRLFQVMLFQHDKYQVLAAQQHRIEEEITAQRGEIFTAKNFPLVVNSDAYLLFAVPKDMEDKEATSENLAKLLAQSVVNIPINESHVEKLKQEEPPASDNEQPEDDSDETPESEVFVLPQTLHRLRHQYHEYTQEQFEASFVETFNVLFDDDANQFVQLISSLEPGYKKDIETLHLKGLHFQEESIRSYPEGTMAAHLLGIVGKDSSGNAQGYFGIEGYFDGDLSGRSGYKILEKDVLGKPIPYGFTQERDASHGRDFVLTIERELQYLLEKNLAEGVKKYRAKNGTGILMDVNTGRVLAMANYPVYNPEFWTEVLAGESDVSKVELFRNYAIADNYEPGSVVKPITMSMALQEGLVEPATTYFDGGPVTYSGYEVKTWNNKYAHENITMMQVLQRSHNTGAAWVGHQVGFDNFGDYIDQYGFGQTTNITLEGEEAGIVRQRTDWRDIDLANMSFGQGISVTPIQMTSIFSALVNGGRLYKPQIVDKIYDYRKDQPTEITLDTELLANPITEETSEKIRYMLRSVVTDGEFTWFVKQAGMDKYSIGGKTGTAQIPVNGQYDPNKTNTTFVGFAPVEDPQFVLFMKLGEPSTSTYSADTVVPMWMKTARELMVYFGIAPE